MTREATAFETGQTRKSLVMRTVAASAKALNKRRDQTCLEAASTVHVLLTALACTCGPGSTWRCSTRCPA
eukprot:CAMPEP_0179128612 /NCGR_PEP_ID=MMETSP0796-20121207/60988_1 /TAXON_ID=73915 /ORGANISM="Pyrodinium bahamense, Strain pbaha01" /LENGTH=69 /DNA_ID=CAMNT_0020827465 /DNA_START=108 /DNA_END=314 /DNA_ORIENTATION=-